MYTQVFEISSKFQFSAFCSGWAHHIWCTRSSFFFARVWKEAKDYLQEITYKKDVLCVIRESLRLISVCSSLTIAQHLKFIRVDFSTSSQVIWFVNESLRRLLKLLATMFDCFLWRFCNSCPFSPFDRSTSNFPLASRPTQQRRKKFDLVFNFD